MHFMAFIAKNCVAKVQFLHWYVWESSGIKDLVFHEIGMGLPEC